MKEGKLELLEKIRTQKKAELRLLTLLKESLEGKSIQKMAMIHVWNNLPGAEKLLNEFRTQVNCPADVIMAQFTPGLSVHAGDGVIGFAVLTK